MWSSVFDDVFVRDRFSECAAVAVGCAPCPTQPGGVGRISSGGRLASARAKGLGGERPNNEDVLKLAFVHDVSFSSSPAQTSSTATAVIHRCNPTTHRVIERGRRDAVCR